MTDSIASSDIATTVQWATLCKDCRADRAAAERRGERFQRRREDLRREDFDYPDIAVNRTLERGGTRSDRCPECRKRHREKIAAFPVAYVDITAIGEARVDDPAIGPTGPLGGLGPLPELHERTETPVDLLDFEMGLTAKNICTLLEKMHKCQVVVLEAGTGTGKSTLGPFRLMNPPPGACYRPTDLGPIIVTQPRVPATTEVAKFVGEAMCFGHDASTCTRHIGPGYPVGYQCDGQKVWDDSCQLIYVTDGTLINWITNGDLYRYSTIIIDEAHERSANIDTILVLLRENLHRYPRLRVVIASATIDPQYFLEYFADAAGGTDHLYVPPKKSIGYGVPLFSDEDFSDDEMTNGIELDGQRYKGWSEERNKDSDHLDLRAETRKLLELRPPALRQHEGCRAGVGRGSTKPV